MVDIWARPGLNLPQPGSFTDCRLSEEYFSGPVLYPWKVIAGAGDHFADISFAQWWPMRMN